jgi:hypothetical protein
MKSSVAKHLQPLIRHFAYKIRPPFDYMIIIIIIIL